MFKKLLAGKRPTNLGLHQGRLRRCPPLSKNCVISELYEVPQGRVENPRHITPLVFAGSPSEAMARLMKVLETEPGCEIIIRNAEYLHVEATSHWLGFVDDLEFRLHAQRSQIEMRSASRLGISDLGVNRARLERIREAFDELAEADRA